MVYFNSWDEKCKTPFGAIEKDSKACFTVFSDSCDKCYIVLNGNEIEMEKCSDGFTKEIKFESLELVFYYFRLITQNGISYYLGKGKYDNSEFSLYTPDRAFQVTVTECKEALPDWYTKGIVYQIFPDRFCREGGVLNPKNNIHIYDNWSDTPKYLKNEKGEIEKWDFFGGNLKGIISKLDYLKSLNVSVIYLNPVFEACSNHRYNTADYFNIDPMLGSEEDFEELIKKADEKGIKIILDGVFNHTGADSIYFNKFSNYGSDGAYVNENSGYRSWFKFDEYPKNYKSWWGVGDLPTLNTENPEVQDYLIENENSVINKWTAKGIGGWRLDVADELSDNFLLKLNKEVKKYGGKIVIGEVWEDASNKISYDVRKSYFAKPELDGVMNYPLRDNLLLFYQNKINAFELRNIYMTQMENYPTRNFMANLNLIDSHDVERILTCAKDINAERCFDILKQLVTLQFVFPGVPCIYYGDEAGLEGRKDPDNRRTYPWGNENKELLEFYRKTTALRAESELLKSGKTLFDAIDNDIFCVVRYNDTEKFVLYVNRSGEEKTFICPYTQKEISLNAFESKIL